MASVVGVATACGGDAGTSPPAASASAAASGSSAPLAAIPPAGSPDAPSAGSLIATSRSGDRLFISDEDHEALFVVPTTFGDLSSARAIPLPGPPGQLVVRGDRIFVTIRTVPTAESRAARDPLRGPLMSHGASGGMHTLPTSVSRTKTAKPAGAGASDAYPSASASGPSPSASAPPGPPPKPPRISRAQTPRLDAPTIRKSEGALLIALAPDATQGFVEVGRVKLPVDAWGVALTSDGKRAVVSSAWASEVSVVDVSDPAAMKVTKTLAVAREPRAIVIPPGDRTAFVSHLVGSALTRIDDLSGDPVAAPQPLAPSPTRYTPGDKDATASLGWSLALDPSGRTLFAPRHALGAPAGFGWWGAPTVDVLDVATGRSLQPVRTVGKFSEMDGFDLRLWSASWQDWVDLPPEPRLSLVQPRAVVYRRSTDTLLVAGEGFDTVSELDARAADPSLAVLELYPLVDEYDPFGDFPTRGGAPSGLALSADEGALFVWCRTTFDVARVDLATHETTWLHVVDDGLSDVGERGRRLYANASSWSISGGLACAACHPEGRDDGFRWRETDDGYGRDDGRATLHFVGSNDARRATNDTMLVAKAQTNPRQTPMLAGRVRSNGPYGWRGGEKDIADRVREGSALHRGWWAHRGLSGEGADLAKTAYLIDFIRGALIPPPTLDRPLDDVEKKGKELFESAAVGCARCHDPAREMTDRAVVELPALPTLPGFHAETSRFKTPSLWFVGGSAPYFHDGSAATLEDLVAQNGTRMGNTAGLGPADRAALVAYLRTL